MAIAIERADYEFFLRSMRFCESIDKYSAYLGLNEIVVAKYKRDTEELTFVFNNVQRYSSCAESFTRYKINGMREKFRGLALMCKRSSNYNVAIGHELGVEVAVRAFDNN